MKNCIVLSGQYRTFDQTWERIKGLIDVNNLDVYCHLWSTDVNEVNNVVERLKPVKYLVEDSSKHMLQFQNIQRNILLNNPKPLSIDKLAGNASMNYSRKKAFELIEEEYDSLVYCRYDVAIHNPILIDKVEATITPLEESYNLISDIFAAMPFKDAKHYFLYDQYEKLHSTPFEPEFVDWLRNVKKYPERDIKIHIEQRYCPHMMLMRNLIMNGVTFISENIPVRLQR